MSKKIVECKIFTSLFHVKYAIIINEIVDYDLLVNDKGDEVDETSRLNR